MQFLKNKFENFQGLKLVEKIAFGLCLIGFAFAFFSCNLTSNGKTTQTVTFNSLYDSIKTDDSALIVFKTEDGKLLDTVFHGRIINKAGFANLPVANWDGGLVVIFITVYKENKIVFQYERHVDGKTNQTTSSFITVAYHNGVDTTKVIPVDTTKKLPTDTTKNPPIDTTKVKPPDTTTQVHSDGINVSPRILKLYTGGEVLAITAKVLPVTISQKVKWMSTNPTIAKVDDSGKVTPVAPGNVKVYATSLADTSKRDSADVTVKRDEPQVSVGQDTVVSLGKTVEFLPVVAPQEYGLVTTFKWDLNGDGAWDDSSASVKLVSYKYDQDKEYLVRFYVRDTEGNETIVTKKVKTSQGPIVLITSPLNNSYTNKRTVVVVWSINDAIQDSLNTQVLKDSVNTITRTAYDAAKKPFSSSITVYFDSIPPNKPIVHGNGLTSSLTPSWSWSSGGAGGNGGYRWAMDLEVFTSSPEIKDTIYTPTVPLTEGVHTLYVQERDNAGNWSASGTLAIKIDKTPPAKPVVKVTEGGLTNAVKPTFTWASAGGGNGTFQWKLDNQDLSFGATTTTDLSYLSVAALASGQHTMYVRERDTTGNWSDLGSAQVTVDVDPPSAPILLGTTPTSSAPTWTWTTGGNGGSGDFRYKLGDANFTVANGAGKDLTYSVSGAASGITYTLYVEEKDAAGNWSLPTSKTITYDLSKPNVTFSLPQLSGIYLTSASTVDVSGTSVSPQGAGSIKTVTYTIDGVAGSLATNLVTASGTWSIKAVPLTNNKTIVIKVTATDALGNSGEASLSLLMDNTPPLAPKIETYPAAIITTASGVWSWSATADPTGSGFNDKFQYSLNNSGWTPTNLLSVTITSLREGLNTFSVQEQDKALNWSSSATSTIRLDSKGPTLNIVSPVSLGGTYNETANPSVLIKINTVDTGSGINKVQCQLGNASVFSLVDQGNGNWTYTQNFPSGNTSVTCTSYDNYSNSSSGNFSVNVAIPKPVITNLDFKSGMVFNKSLFTVNFVTTLNGVQYNESQSIDLGSSDGKKTIRLTTKKTNVVGETGYLDIDYYLKSKAIFIDPAASGTTHDGSSWLNAYQKLETALKDAKINNQDEQLWISKGEYIGPGITNDYNNNDEALVLPSNLRMLGGFNAVDLPNDSSSMFRNSNNHTVIKNYPLANPNVGKYFEFSVLEFNNVYLRLNSTTFGAKFVITKCILRGGSERYMYSWGITSSGYGIETILNQVDVTNELSPAGNMGVQFLLYEQMGSFTATNSTFYRLPNGPKQAAVVGQSSYGSITFNECTMNYGTTGTANFNVDVENSNTSLVFTGTASKIIQGLPTIKDPYSFSYFGTMVTSP